MHRTLVCILCQTRSWEVTWPGFKNNILDALHADLALCVSIPENYNYQNPFWQHAKYKTTFPEYEDWATAFDHAQDVELNFTDNKPNWRKLLEYNKGYWLGGIKHEQNAHSGSGAIATATRWHLLQFIESERIFEKYDRLILTRSDFMHTIPHPHPILMDPRFIWIPDGEGYGGLTDKHVILSKYNYRSYLDLLTKIITNPDEIFRTMAGNDWNFEKFMKFSIFEKKAQVKCYPFHMYVIKQKNENTAWAKASYQSEHGHYIKHNDEYHQSTALTALVQNQKDWDNVINNCTFDNCFNAPILTSNNNYITFDQALNSYVEISPEKNPAYVVSMDCKNDKGELFMSCIHTGFYERQSMQKIIVVEKNPDYFVMETLDTREKVFMHNSHLSKSHNMHGDCVFKLKNRYHKVITE